MIPFTSFFFSRRTAAVVQLSQTAPTDPWLPPKLVLLESPAYTTCIAYLVGEWAWHVVSWHVDYLTV